jgi:hypothetical protein
MTPEELSWAAGLFEGEGSIMIRRHVRGEARHGVCHLVCAVQMTDDEPVLLFHQWWGGRVGYKERSDQLNSRPTAQWRVMARVAAAFLTDIRPYLRTDRVCEKAELAIEFQAQKIAPGRPGQAIPGYAERQEHFHLRMKALNARGRETIGPIEVPDPPPTAQLAIE